VPDFDNFQQMWDWYAARATYWSTWWAGWTFFLMAAGVVWSWLLVIKARKPQRKPPKRKPIKNPDGTQKTDHAGKPMFKIRSRSRFLTHVALIAVYPAFFLSYWLLPPLTNFKVAHDHKEYWPAFNWIFNPWEPWNGRVEHWWQWLTQIPPHINWWMWLLYIFMLFFFGLVVILPKGALELFFRKVVVAFAAILVIFATIGADWSDIHDLLITPKPDQALLDAERARVQDLTCRQLRERVVDRKVELDEANRAQQEASLAGQEKADRAQREALLKYEVSKADILHRRTDCIPDLLAVADAFSVNGDCIVTLKATGSKAWRGVFTWTLDTGNPNSREVRTTDETETVRMSPGNYTITLMVEDGLDRHDRNTANVTVGTC
jgi:hypothetical protein